MSNKDLIEKLKNESDDVRIGETITNGTKGDIVLVGFPYDEGVNRNGGRLGSREGPKVLRSLMKRIGTLHNPENNIDCSNVYLTDGGDIEEGLELEKGHEKLTHFLYENVIKRGGIPFVIGGGNDQSFPNALSLIKKFGAKNVGVVNIDAHFDVRPKKLGKVHSGSPFRMLLETEGFKGENFHEFACQGIQCSMDHTKYLKKKNSGIHWLSSIKKMGVKNAFKKLVLEPLDKQTDAIFVSFDLDSVRGSDAPGVSCPGTIGLTANEALEICFEAGKHPKVLLFDLSEFNPKIEDYRTGRLVANMFVQFVMGYSTRKLNKNSS